MKKIFALLLCAALILCFAGCAGDTENEQYGSNTQNGDTADNGVMGYSGTINKKWNSVEDEYSDLEDEAKREVDEMKSVTRADVEKLVTEIETGTKTLKNGVTDKNETTAKKVYKDACKLEILARRGETDATREFENLAKNTKALVKQYYGVADDDYDTVSDAVASGLEKVKGFSDDIWNAFIDLFK